MKHLYLLLFLFSLLTSIFVLGMSFFSITEREIKLRFQGFILILSLYILQDLVFTYINNSSIELSTTVTDRLELIAFSSFLILTSWNLVYLAANLSDKEMIHRGVINIVFTAALTSSMILLQFETTANTAIFVLIVLFCCNVLFHIVLVLRNIKEPLSVRLTYAGAFLVLIWAVLEDFVIAFLPDVEVYPIANILLNALILLFFKSHMSPAGKSPNPELSLSEWFEKNELTSREQEITALLAKGYDKPGIASLLNISDHTVKTHIIHIYEKCSLNSKYQLISRIFRETDFTG